MTEDQRRATLHREIREAVDRYLAGIEGRAIRALPHSTNWPPQPAEIDPNDGTWLTVKEAAHEFSLDPTTVRRRAKNAGIRIGGKVLIKRDRMFGDGR